MKKYQIIYADPPWFYNKRNLRKKDGTRNNFAWGATNHYPVMKTQDICELPIKDLADESCMLCMWATFPRLNDAMQVIKAWGFEYITVGFVWVKTQKDGNVRMDGVGNYTMANSEICLIGRKGKYWRNETGIKQVVLHPRMEHSKKPEEVRKRIVNLFGDLPRIELFAREKSDGWTSIGNDIDGVDIVESIKLLAR